MRHPLSTTLAAIVLALVHSTAAVAAGGADILVNDPALDSGGTIQSETTIATAGDVVCIGFNDTGEGSNGGVGYAYSSDGGATFTDGGSFMQSNITGDPTVAYSVRYDEFYFVASGSNQGGSPTGLRFFRSTDGCQSWVNLGRATAPTTFDDKAILIVDNDSASPHYGRIHIVYTNAGFALVTFSTFSDLRGAVGSWSSPNAANVSETAFAAWPALAPNGDLYMSVGERDAPSKTQDHLMFLSTNGGSAPWVQRAPIGSDQPWPGDDAVFVACGSGFPALNGDIRVLTSSQIAIQQVESPTGFVIHAVYARDPDDASASGGSDGADDSSVFYRRSFDGAQTWEPTETLLTPDPGNTDQWNPALAVRDDGVVVVSWYDRRLDPANNLLFDRYVVVSEDGGDSFGPIRRVSDVSSPVSQNNPPFETNASVCYHGEYDQVAIAGNTVLLIWSDDRRIDPLTGPNPDVYFDRVSLDQDGDEVLDGADNCSEFANASQTDADNDGFGNACDCDLLNDGVCGIYDAWAMGWCGNEQLFPPCEAADMANDDLVIDEDDGNRFQEQKPLGPGPSGLSCAGSVPCPAP